MKIIDIYTPSFPVPPIYGEAFEIYLKQILCLEQIWKKHFLHSDICSMHMTNIWKALKFTKRHSIHLEMNNFVNNIVEIHTQAFALCDKCVNKK